VWSANGSAAGLVNILARDFPCFRDEFKFESRRKPVRLLKRAQILVADLWACFDGQDYGDFYDIGKITMFADYRVPQILQSMGCLYYSPSLMSTIKHGKTIKSGSYWELQIRGTLSRPHSHFLALEGENNRINSLCRMQHLVRRADQEGNSQEPPGCPSQCNFD